MPASRYNFRMTEEQLAAKSRMRKKLASLSFSEKIKILEKLRDRSLVLAAAGLRQDKGKCGAVVSRDDSER